MLVPVVMATHTAWQPIRKNGYLFFEFPENMKSETVHHLESVFQSKRLTRTHVVSFPISFVFFLVYIYHISNDLA